MHVLYKLFFWCMPYFAHRACIGSPLYTFPNTHLVCLSLLQVWQPSGPLILYFLVYLSLLKKFPSGCIIVGNFVFMDIKNDIMKAI